MKDKVQQSPREILSNLISMRNNAGSNLFVRLKLTNELLSNREWVEDPSGGGGDASCALDRLEEDCFGPEAGMSLPEMLEVLAAVPQETIWKRNRYCLRKMWLEMKERQEAMRRRNIPTSKDGNKEVSDSGTVPTDEEVGKKLMQDEIAFLKTQLREAKATIKGQHHEIVKLRRIVKKLQEALDDLQVLVD